VPRANSALLWGFPNENPQDYEEMSRLIPLIRHLPPPSGFGPIRLDRYSPNYERSAEIGLRNVAAYPAYDYVYPFDSHRIGNLAYFFVYDYADDRDPEQYMGEVAQALSEWQMVHHQCALFHLVTEDYVT
jgi:hypothetical protein